MTGQTGPASPEPGCRPSPETGRTSPSAELQDAQALLRWSMAADLRRPPRVLEPGDFAAIRDALWELTGIDLDDYHTQQLERRLSAWLARCGVETGQAFARLLWEAPEELDRFRQFLTINVSSFYRDASRWVELEHRVLPELLRSASQKGLRAWSVGCSVGAEPFTLAMLLLEQAPDGSHRIRATDIDRRSLIRARRGGPYVERELQELPPHLAHRFLEPTGSGEAFVVKPQVRRMVHFMYGDVLRESMPPNCYDLILCRNVVIYFTPRVRAQVFGALVQALRPGGVLFVGGTETISHYWELGLEYLAPSLYQWKRPGPV